MSNELNPHLGYHIWFCCSKIYSKSLKQKLNFYDLLLELHYRFTYRFYFIIVKYRVIDKLINNWVMKKFREDEKMMFKNVEIFFFVIESIVGKRLNE